MPAVSAAGARRGAADDHLERLGVLVAVFAFGASLAMELSVEAMTRDDEYFQREAWPLALAFVVAGLVTWFVGKKLNAHTFFFVPMRYWGVVLLALAPLPFVLRR